jgi:REP element-mobilizing transposase RayT
MLWTLSVRTNHIHVVVSANKTPGAVLTAMKPNATRSMKNSGRWQGPLSPWARGGSKKYLWTEKQLADAMAYVDCDQGENLA